MLSVNFAIKETFIFDNEVDRMRRDISKAERKKTRKEGAKKGEEKNDQS